MSRHSLVKGIRLIAMLTMLASLLLVAGSVAAAGPAVGNGLTATQTDVPYGSFTTTINIDCGQTDLGTPNTCQVYVSRNNNDAQGTETSLFATVTGSKQQDANFIVDGCYNFRSYNGTGHAILLDTVDVGHANANGTLRVCQPGPSGFRGGKGQIGGSKAGGAITIPAGSGTDVTNSSTTAVNWDSGFENKVEDATVFVSQTPTGKGTGGMTNNIFSQLPSAATTPSFFVGGVYTLDLRQGKLDPFGKLLGTYTVNTTVYEVYNSSSKVLSYNTADNNAGAVCVTITGPGPGNVTNKLFTGNSLGYGKAQATFQTAGKTVNYLLMTNVTLSAANPCTTGTPLYDIQVVS